ncbi:MAG: hypothetical protein KR126chlam1_00760 [Chlamydiae bacterium]|nr:hypothetical protein [Chlamydiota bacterium]
MGKIFKRGLLTLAPVAISLAIIIWLFDTLENIFRVPVQWLVGDYYFTGMGLIVAFVLIFFVGIAINNILIQKITSLVNRILARIPLFKIFYNSIGDLMRYFRPSDGEKKGKMVVVDLDGMQFLGILTREDYEGFPEGLGGEDQVTVFVPLSYQIGGFTTTVPRSKVKLIDLTVEQGMRFVVTAGIAGVKGEKK